MIDFKTRTLELNGITRPIIKFDVWWQTPFGLTGDLDHAIKVCEDHDLDPNSVIVPYPVAITDSEHELIMR